jgi:glycopeptide antibiotics resistance protein
MNRAQWLLTAYLVVLAALTFLPLDGLDTAAPVDLRLQAFRTISFALRKGVGSYQFLVLVGNAAAFVPLGVLVPLALRRHSALLVVATALCVSVGIEVGQYLLSLAVGWGYRSADIDDVIVNVCGAMVGYALLAVASSLRHGRVTARS